MLWIVHCQTKKCCSWYIFKYIVVYVLDSIEHIQFVFIVFVSGTKRNMVSMKHSYVWADERVEQVKRDAVEAQVHVPAHEARVPARRARLPALRARALPAVPGPVPGAKGHQDEGEWNGGAYLHPVLIRLSRNDFNVVLRCSRSFDTD